MHLQRSERFTFDWCGSRTVLGEGHGSWWWLEGVWSCLHAAVEWLREKLIAYGSSDRGHSARYAFIVVRHGCIWVSRMLASSFWCVCFLQISDTDEQTRYTTDTADHTSPHVSSTRANKIASRPCSATSSHTKSKARVKIRAQGCDFLH